MVASVRRALITSIGLMVVRRRLQRQSGPGAAVALLGLELFGPRILQARRLLRWALALTIVGGIAVAAIWWWRRSGSTTPVADPWPEPEPEPAAEPEPEPEPVVPPVAEPVPPPAAA
jgi:hypothetical protein